MVNIRTRSKTAIDQNWYERFTCVVRPSAEPVTEPNDAPDDRLVFGLFHRTKLNGLVRSTPKPSVRPPTLKRLLNESASDFCAKPRMSACGPTASPKANAAGVVNAAELR